MDGQTAVKTVPHPKLVELMKVCWKWPIIVFMTNAVNLQKMFIKMCHAQQSASRIQHA